MEMRHSHKMVEQVRPSVLIGMWEEPKQCKMTKHWPIIQHHRTFTVCNFGWCMENHQAHHIQHQFQNPPAAHCFQPTWRNPKADKSSRVSSEITAGILSNCQKKQRLGTRQITRVTLHIDNLTIYIYIYIYIYTVCIYIYRERECDLVHLLNVPRVCI